MNVKVGSLADGAEFLWRGERYTKQPSLHPSLTTIRGRRDERVHNNTEVIPVQDVYKVGGVLLVRNGSGWKTLKGEPVLVAGTPTRATMWDVYDRHDKEAWVWHKGKAHRVGGVPSGELATLCDAPAQPAAAFGGTTFGELEVGETFKRAAGDEVWVKVSSAGSAVLGGSSIHTPLEMRVDKTRMKDAKPGDSVTFFGKHGVVTDEGHVRHGLVFARTEALPPDTVVRITARPSALMPAPQKTMKLLPLVKNYEVLANGRVYLGGKEYDPQGYAAPYGGCRGTGVQAPSADGTEAPGTLLLRDCGWVREVVRAGRVESKCGTKEESYTPSFYRVLNAPKRNGRVMSLGGKEWVVIGGKMFERGTPRPRVVPVAGVDTGGYAPTLTETTPAGSIVVWEKYGELWEVTGPGEVRLCGATGKGGRPEGTSFVLYAAPEKRVKRYQTLVIGGKRYLVLDVTVPSGKPHKLLDIDAQREVPYGGEHYEVL